MKYFTNLFVFLAWYLEKISDINATSITQEERIQKLRLSEKLKSDLIPRTEVMIVIERNVLLLNQFMMYNVKYSENSLQISEIGETGMYYLSSIAKAPDGAFDVPSVTVTSEGRISQIDVSDPMRPRIASDLGKGSRSARYISHVWINKNEFLAVSDVLLHFENKNKGETKEWNSKKVSSGKILNMLLFQYDPKSFNILYARGFPDIVIMWAEDAEGKPGDWQNEKHIRKKYITNDANYMTSADVNNDEKTELLVLNVLTKKVHGKMELSMELKALEIPHSDEFKNPDKYKEHVLFPYPIGEMCIKQLKAFIPFVSYKGKQWLLVGEDICGGGSYLQPMSEDVGNWSYKRNKFFSSDKQVLNIEVADINQDGYTELFLLADHLYVYSFSNGKIIVTDPPLNTSSISSSSSIFYLDSTLPDSPPIPTSSIPSSSIRYLDSTLPDPPPTPTSFVCVVSVIIVIIVIIVVVAFLLFKFDYLSRLADFFGY